MSRQASNQPKIVVVTPIHNGIKHTLAYLESLSKVKYGNFEVIIIDDGSTDGSPEKILAKYPKTIILKGDGNLWWSGATNLGVKAAMERKADYVFTINNDVELHPDVFNALVDCEQRHTPSLVGCKIYYMNDHNKVWYFGGEMNPKVADVEMKHGVEADFMVEEETGVLTGMGVLIPVQAFREAGFYDEKNFPQYLADSDFSLRAKEKGYKLIVTPAAKVYSDVASSWLRKALKHPTPKFIWELFFHKRSPHSIPIRYKFYKRYWPNQKRRMLVKFYYLLAKKMVRPNAIVE